MNIAKVFSFLLHYSHYMRHWNLIKTILDGSITLQQLLYRTATLPLRRNCSILCVQVNLKVGLSIKSNQISIYFSRHRNMHVKETVKDQLVTKSTAPFCSNLRSWKITANLNRLPTKRKCMSNSMHKKHTHLNKMGSFGHVLQYKINHLNGHTFRR